MDRGGRGMFSHGGIKNAQLLGFVSVKDEDLAKHRP
jgi:hypothetical protein